MMNSAEALKKLKDDLKETLMIKHLKLEPKEIEELKRRLEKHVKKGEDEEESNLPTSMMSLISSDKEDASFSTLVYAFMVIKQQEIENLTKRLEHLEEDEDTKYPNDTYTMIALNHPFKNKEKDGVWMIFGFGILIWAFQMLFITLLITSVFYSFFKNEEYVAGDPLMIVAEFAAIICYTMIPDASLQDIVTAYRQWPEHDSKDDKNIHGRQIACTLRAIQGLSASVTVLFLINIAPNVIDIVLNFTALNFVSDMDSVAFELAKNGVFGIILNTEANEIATKDLPEEVTGHHHTPYRVVMAACATMMLTVNIILRSMPELREDIYTNWAGESQSDTI